VGKAVKSAQVEALAHCSVVAQTAVVAVETRQHLEAVAQVVKIV
jgi:hypothetical protein